MKFEEFLALARRETYAIPNGTPLGDDTSHMAFDQGPWRYRDRYAGLNPYGGQELVWFEDNVVWLKNYLAEVTSDVCALGDIYTFQRLALGQPDPDHLMRGPAELRDGRFRYKNHIAGDIDRFKGEEFIYFDEQAVYHMILHGGRVRD
ncbi:MAG: hypothetical protein CMO26_06230 [Thiotrichales bacterium]|nr:hypothetical protein [Thiotrichales bacterium]|tara:strand:- start:72 stop:515 length:444 start_codon:yes stop_codon:yes gene_type:complete